MADLPNRIREIRKAQGWTLEQLGNKIGCGTTFVSDLERGNRELSIFWMKKIAKAFKAEAADLFVKEDNSRSLTPEARELVNLYGQADDEQRRQILEMARILVPPRIR